jgi:hypothetical protein
MNEIKPQVKTHTTKDASWTNAAGDTVPLKFIGHADKVKERNAAAIRNAALKVEKALSDLYDQMGLTIAEVERAVKEEYEIKNRKKKPEGKGNFQWYNFDGSICVASKINDVVKWDDQMMKEANLLLTDYISTSLGEVNVLISKLVSGAFANTKGKIDGSKVFQILSYQNEITNNKFQRACELMRDAQSIDRSKLYMMVSERMENGEFRNINLNFSSI